MSGGLFGGFVVEILFNGSSEFLAEARVDTLASSPHTPTDLSLTQDGEILSSVFGIDVAPTFGLGGAGYRFGAFSGSLDLSPVDGNNTLTYSMTAFVDGLIGETSAIASIGDPISLSGPGVTLTTAPNPEPETCAMLLAGLGLLGWNAKRRKKQQVS